MVDCVFCEIVAGTAHASVVYRDDRVTAFLDHRPVTPGHLMVVPNEHAELLADLDDGTAAHVLTVARRLAAALRGSSLPADGVNLFLADGEAAFQEVGHLHLHVIPRSHGDGFSIVATAWSMRPPSRKELDANAAVIRDALEPG